MTEEKIQSIRDEMEIIDDIDFAVPNEHDYRIMEIVSNVLRDTKCNEYISENILNSADIAIPAVAMLDKSYFKKINNLNYIFNKDETEESNFSTIIGLKDNRCFVDHISLPSKTTRLAKMWLSHEYIHVLKDTNIKEFMRKKVANDTLPIFYEIVLANSKFEDIYEDWKQKRLYMLTVDKNNYKYARDRIMKDVVYKYIMDSYGQYLESYYYALNLYSLFKDDPKTILKYFNDVLKHKMTTNELVKKLDIYDTNKKNINTFIYEHENL